MPTAVCWLLAGRPQVRRTGLLFLLSCVCRWAQILAWREESLTGGISRTEEVAAGQAAQQHPSLGFCLLLKYLAHRRHKKDALFCYVCNEGFFFTPSPNSGVSARKATQNYTIWGQGKNSFGFGLCSRVIRDTWGCSWSGQCPLIHAEPRVTGPERGKLLSVHR